MNDRYNIICDVRFFARGLAMTRGLSAGAAVQSKRMKRQGSSPRLAVADGSNDATQGAEDSAKCTFCVPGLAITDHVFEVPLNHWSSEAGETIKVFARELTAYGKAHRSAPYLLYLQGGPGFEAARPTEASGWIKAATNHFRVILLDQRGTGRSAPIS
eukprot:scaffold63934_cov49-Prasinocladus_malaysianus.AAC.1